MSCAQCKQKTRERAVLQADFEFELKKLQEDLSLEKVALEMQFQKESKRLAERCNKQKVEREEENRKWIGKYDSMVGEHLAQLDRLRCEHERDKARIEKEVGKKYQEEKMGFSKTVGEIRKTHDEERVVLMESHRREVNKLQSAGEELVRRLKEEQQQLINEITYDYEGKIALIRKDNAQKDALYEKLKTEGQLSQAGLCKEIYLLKQALEEMKGRCEGLQAELRKAESDLRRKEEELESVLLKNETRVQVLTKRFEQQREGVVAQLSLQMQNLLRSKLQDCEKFEEKVKVIVQKRETEVRMYQSSLQEVKELVQVRQSRGEDVEEINTLRNILIQKQKELKEAIEDARACRLELDNKEETFNRIFTSNPQTNERMVRRRQIRVSKPLSLTKETTKYNSVGTCNNLGEPKREIRLLPPSSSKQF